VSGDQTISPHSVDYSLQLWRSSIVIVAHPKQEPELGLEWVVAPFQPLDGGGYHPQRGISSHERAVRQP
jgi:hypothetical protein